MSDSLVLRGVSRSYWRGERRLPVLVDISLEVGPGEIVAVVGSRDEGKTTLLKVAAGMVRPDEGDVKLGGRDLTKLSSIERERLLGSVIAWTDREPPRVPWKVRDYVGMPLTMGRGLGRRKARDLAMVALELVGAAGCATQRWCELSNWERMLAGLARGIVARPQLLLIDDLLDGFGMRRTSDLGDLVRSLVDELGCGVLMSSTGVEAALIADRVWSFGRGRLKLMSDQAGTDAEVIDFPKGVGRDRGSRSVGS